MSSDKINVLLVDAALDGHHLNYINGLAKIGGCKIIGLFPKGIEDKFLPNIKKIFRSEYVVRRDGLHGYCKWIKEIGKIIKQERPDVVHFLDGDSIMKYFGFCMKSLNRPIVITYHHFFNGFLRALSYQCMCHKRYPVVHTELIKEQMTNLGVKNSTHIEYPVFSYDVLIKTETAKAKNMLGIAENEVVLGMIGTINRYKGYDILFEALKYTDKKYHILIAGQPNNYSYEELKKNVEKTGMPSTIIPIRLTEEQYNTMIAASDIIMLPYSAEFNGASGPLADGACCSKLIICSGHGSLGELVRENHIGYTFDTGDYNDLANVLNEVDVATFAYDDVANSYRNMLKPERFTSEYETLYRKIVSGESDNYETVHV